MLDKLVASNEMVLKQREEYGKAAELEKHGGQVVPFKFEARGMRSWSVVRGV